jgi:PAS domain S-box-containing protein
MLLGSYNYWLVALSVVIAMLASYAALDLGGRVTAARGRARMAWLMGGGAAMGLGVWSMHYIGMLAFTLPVPVLFDWPTVVLSLCAAILASVIALHVVSGEKLGRSKTLAGSVLMGSGIAAMHYIGMEAMRLPAMCQYDFWLVILSVALAILISLASIWLSFHSREEKEGRTPRKIASAAVMGTAIPVMHYTGMAAATFMRTSRLPDLTHAMGVSALRTFGITMVTMLVLGLAIVSSIIDRRYSAQTSELESAEKRYRLLFERSLAGFIRTTLDGTILDCNLSCAKMFGYASCDELKATSMTDRYLDLEDRNIFIARLKEEKHLSNYEHRTRGKDGATVWLLGSANLVEGRDGTPSVNEETLINITERKNAEETFRKAFNANPEPIAISTMSDGLYLDVNQSFLRITGYRREEVIGRTAWEIKLWERPEDRIERLAILEKQGFVRNLPMVFRTRSGEQRIALGSSEVIEVGGKRCIITILRDMTEQKLLEKQLRQSQKMEAIGQLSGGIAHDFNNLLSVIIGYSEVIEDQLPPNDPLQRKCREIKKAGVSAASLTRQLLAFSRQQVMEARILDLNAIVQNVEKMLRRLIGEDIELVTALDPGVGPINADQGQIEQIILNLVVNSRDAMPHGGKLTIETSNVEVDEEYARQHPPQLPGPYVMLMVSDTGIGMDSETQAHIFEPFFTTKEVGKGTGLGLSTVYGVVRQSGGHIWVNSGSNTGTTFRIYMPAVSQNLRAEKPKAVSARLARGTGTILLVEDAEALRQLTRELLVECGYTVLEADHPEKAIEIANRYDDRIHLLLTDMVMPGMNGEILAERLSAIRPEMRVVYMSGHIGFSHAGPIGCDGNFLQKPFSKEALLRKLQEVLAVEAEVSEA